MRIDRRITGINQTTLNKSKNKEEQEKNKKDKEDSNKEKGSSDNKSFNDIFKDKLNKKI